MTDVAAFSGVTMEPGTLYGALARLERRGWVRPLATAGRRRSYEITATWPARAGHGDAAGPRSVRTYPLCAIPAFRLLLISGTQKWSIWKHIHGSCGRALRL
jgi:hypothetical protein